MPSVLASAAADKTPPRDDKTPPRDDKTPPRDTASQETTRLPPADTKAQQARLTSHSTAGRGSTARITCPSVLPSPDSTISSAAASKREEGKTQQARLTCALVSLPLPLVASLARLVSSLLLAVLVRPCEPTGHTNRKGGLTLAPAGLALRSLLLLVRGLSPGGLAVLLAPLLGRRHRHPLSSSDLCVQSPPGALLLTKRVAAHLDRRQAKLRTIRVPRQCAHLAGRG